MLTRPPASSPSATTQNVAKLALRFVLLIGIVNFFADMTYEGARGIVGPFLGSLGASAAVVGFFAGLGELAGYALRSISGYFADKTRQYWLMAFAGYAVNMLAVPAMALAGNWPLAAALMVTERTGRALRKPAVESMLSHAGRSLGQGWVFGLNEALDQTGATLGPLITAWVLYRRGDYHHAFAWLLVPALLCLVMVVVAWALHRRPHELEEEQPQPAPVATFSTAYWLYLLAGGLIAAGFADFSLIAFHFRKTGTVAQDLVPVFYAIAMAAGALSAPIFGKLLDRAGVGIFAVALWRSGVFRAVRFSGADQNGTGGNDPLGNWTGSPGFLPASGACHHSPLGKTEHRVRRVRYRVRFVLVRRERHHGLVV